ncbi:MAG: VF530 family DNA-binding protein [Bacteroidota bacterium]
MREQQPNNPLHGVKLKDIVEYLVEEIGWENMADEVPVRCFQYDPSIKSSLVFLRRTQWARDRIEALYLATIKKGNNAPSDKGTHGKYSTRKR